MKDKHISGLLHFHEGYLLKPEWYNDKGTRVFLLIQLVWALSTSDCMNALRKDVLGYLGKKFKKHKAKEPQKATLL